MGSKPRVLVEIRRGGRISPFVSIAGRINLSLKLQEKTGRVLTLGKLVLLIASVWYLFLGSAMAPVYYSQTFAAQNSEQDRAVLEQQLLQLEQQISQYESTVTSYKKQGKSLQAEINNLNTKIKKINLQIKAAELTLSQLDNEIVKNKAQVSVAEENLNSGRQSLAGALQHIYEQEKTGLVEMLLTNPQLSDFVTDINGFYALQDDLREVVQKIENLREQLLDAREQLNVKKADATALKQYQDQQRTAIANVQKEKNNLLAVTKGQESKYQDLLQKTKKSAAEIRSRIFEFLGGGELTFEEAYKFAKVAESATGVRAALLLAVLDKESALGQNVGRCDYKAAMHPTRDIPIFLALTSALAINPDTVTVSCANRDGAYGGAMGPAQFIPSTWNLYTARIADITGSNPPSPWRNSDAFVATSLYLKDAGAYKGATMSEERKAAARYYAGARWQRFLWSYGDRVVTQAQQFQQDIDVLNG